VKQHGRRTNATKIGFSDRKDNIKLLFRTRRFS
jgi:hypothetical protein